MKLKLKRLLMGLALLSLAYSCQSLEDEGEELFQKGLYQEALIKFEAAVSKDPSSASAKAWVQKLE